MSTAVQLPTMRPDSMSGTPATVETFWKTLMADAIPSTLPLAGATDKNSTNARNKLKVTASAAVAKSLQRAAQELGVAGESVILSGWALLLVRYGAEAEVFFGMNSSPQAAGVDLLPFRLTVKTDEILADWVSRVHTRSLEVQRHTADEGKTSTAWSSFLASNPSYETTVRFHTGNRPEPQGLLADLFVSQGPEIGLDLSFDSIRLTEPAARHILGHLLQLLEQFALSINVPISEISFLTPDERAQLLIDWNQTGCTYSREACIHELFERQARKTPDAVAVIFDSIRLSYRELDEQSNQFAHHLRTLGVRPGARVGVCTERSARLLVALMAVLKAGGAYIPIDPGFPAERISFVLEDAKTALLVSQESHIGIIQSGETPVFYLDRDWPGIAAMPTSALEGITTPTDLAYTIYTSGSTGKPKGVQIEHRALVNFIEAMAKEPGLTSDDRLLAITTTSFDIAELEIHLPLTTGATIVVASRETAAHGAALIRTMKDHQITVMQATPATWRLLISAGWHGDPSLKILCGGEPLPTDLTQQLLPRCRELWNMYGPTETTVWSTCAHITDANEIHIGRPIANTDIYICDSRLQPVPIGVSGELLIGGDGLARGYLNRPDLTAEKFIANPFVPGKRVYRTGDLARYRADGAIQCLGRIDFQVKIRGFRIELGEIENVLATFPGVQQTVVTVREDQPGEKRLVAYYIQAPGVALATSDLRTHASAKLPDYMIPAIFVALNALPLTPNGKIDRKSLPAPSQSRPDLAQTYAEPKTSLERHIAQAWQKALLVDRIGLDDPLFELGANSLQAATVHLQIQPFIKREFPLTTLFQYTTVRALSQHLDHAPSTNTRLSAGQERARRLREAVGSRPPFTH